MSCSVARPSTSRPRKGLSRNQEVGCVEEGYSELYTFVFTIGELDQGFLQQGADVEEFDHGGIWLRPASVG